jgi:hypothetical protein
MKGAFGRSVGRWFNKKPSALFPQSAWRRVKTLCAQPFAVCALPAARSLLRCQLPAASCQLMVLGFLVQDEVGGEGHGHELPVLVGDAGLPN